jgi:hypothetical protein
VSCLRYCRLCMQVNPMSARGRHYCRQQSRISCNHDSRGVGTLHLRARLGKSCRISGNKHRVASSGYTAAAYRLVAPSALKRAKLQARATVPSHMWGDAEGSKCSSSGGWGLGISSSGHGDLAALQACSETLHYQHAESGLDQSKHTIWHLSCTVSAVIIPIIWAR